MVEDDAEILVKIEPEGDGLDISKTEPKRDDAGKFTKAVEPAEDLVEQFKTQAESDKKRADAAERQSALDRQEADKARREAATARTEASESQYGSVESGIAAAQSEIESAKKEYRAASEAGDFDKQAEANDRWLTAKAKMLRLDEAKSDLETRRAEKPATERAETKTAPSDPVEAYIANRTEPTANWLREHKDYITDPKKNARLTAAHHNAIADGLSPDTDAYFESVEKFVGLQKAEPEAKANGHTPAKRRATVPVAPVQQSGGSGGSGGTEVRLTKGEYAAATDGTHTWNYDDPSPQKRFKKGDNLGAEEFARRKLALQKQGAYDKSWG